MLVLVSSEFDWDKCSDTRLTREHKCYHSQEQKIFRTELINQYNLYQLKLANEEEDKGKTEIIFQRT